MIPFLLAPGSFMNHNHVLLYAYVRHIMRSYAITSFQFVGMIGDRCHLDTFTLHLIVWMCGNHTQTRRAYHDQNISGFIYKYICNQCENKKTSRDNQVSNGVQFPMNNSHPFSLDDRQFTCHFRQEMFKERL